MQELLNIIDSRVNKKLSNDMSLKSAPCTVVNILENGNIRVKLISNEAEYTVSNYSGSQVQVGETVQLFYKGIINQNSAYIGASLQKSNGDGGLINNCKTEVRVGGLSDTYLCVAKSTIVASCDTNVTVTYNSSLFGVANGTADFIVYVDGTEQDYKPIVSLTAEMYTHINFSVPVFLEQGEHNIEIHGVGTGNVSTAYGFVSGQYIINKINYDEPVESDYVCFTHEATNSEGILYYKGKSGYPTIPTAINGKPVDILYATSFNMTDVKAVYIPDGITQIE